MKTVLILSGLMCCCACGFFSSGSSGQYSYAGGGAGGGGGSQNVTECGTPIDSTPATSHGTPQAISGGVMAATGHGTVVIADSDRAVIWVVKSKGTEMSSLRLAAGDLPGRTIAGPDGTAFVVLRGANQIARVDTRTEQLERFDTCRSPRALSYDPRSAALTVGCADGTLERFHDRAREQLNVSFKVNDLRDLAQDGDRLIATSFRSAQVYSISSTGQTSELPHQNVGDAGVPRVAWRLIPGPLRPLISYQTHLTQALPVTGNTVCSAPSYYNAGTVGANLVTASLGLVGYDAVVQMGQFPSLVLPVDIAVDAVGDYAIVTPNTATELSWSRDRSFTQDAVGFLQLPGETVAVAERDGEWFAFSRDPAMVSYFDKKSFGTVNSVMLRHARSATSTGLRLFHQKTSSNLACASCHPEGGDDGHTWNFSTGPRLTPTLRGGLSMTAPFHWSGDRSTMHELMDDVMVSRMGGSPQAPERIEALTTWLDALAAEAPPPAELASVKRGQHLFESAQTGCATCHAGPLGTNNQLFDVGTGGVFNVPRLIEVAWRPRWMHDGRPSGFGLVNGEERHGHIAQLSESEQRDLLEYVKSR